MLPLLRSAALTVLAMSAFALTACSSGLDAGSGGASGSIRPATPSKAPDSPGFTITDDQMTSAFLSRTELIAAVGQTLDFTQDAPDIEREDLFISASDIPKSSATCIDLVKKLNAMQPEGSRGTLTAKGSDGGRYDLEIDGLQDSATQRAFLDGYRRFGAHCSEALHDSTLKTDSTSVAGGVGLRVTAAGNKSIASLGGYGNLLILAIAPDRSSADAMVVAERKHLDAYVASR